MKPDMWKRQTATTIPSERSWDSLSKGLFVVLIIAWAFVGSFRDIGRVARGLPHMLDYLRGMFPPQFDVLPGLVEPLGETIRSAITGVGMASVIALPLAFLIAKNTSPSVLLYVLGRLLINVARGLPTFLWAILFVSMVGLGPLAGVFAIVCHCVGTFGKQFSDVIESSGPKVLPILEAMRLDGASEAQVIYHGLLPDVAPLFASITIYYLEWAVRVGTILGLVGAGGIGLELTMAIRGFKRQETLAIIIVILVLVNLIDQASRRIREKLLEDW